MRTYHTYYRPGSAGYLRQPASTDSGGKGNAMALTVKATEPITITNVAKVDDAGKVHYESIWTGQFIKALVDEGLLLFEKNIRPDHMEGVRMRAKHATRSISGRTSCWRATR